MYRDYDLEALAAMARDAASNRDGGYTANEYQANEAAVLAAMLTDKENRQPTTPTVEETAKSIYAKVSSVLSREENVFEVCVGKQGERLVSGCTEDDIAALCSLGYFYPTGKTNYAEVRNMLFRDVKEAKEMGDTDKYVKASDRVDRLDNAMESAALSVIVEGLNDGSVSTDILNMTDAEVVSTLIASDNTKEMQIQEAFLPTMKQVLAEQAGIEYEVAPTE